MRIVIYGVGKYYEKRRRELIGLIAKGDELVAFFDRKFENKMEIDGIPAINPILINSVRFDCLVIMSVYVEEIYNLLCDYGVDRGKIYTWKQYRAEKTGGSVRKYNAMIPGKGERVLVISNPLRYDGGSMAAIYLCMALRANNYYVCIATEATERELKKALQKNGIDLAVCQDIPYIGEKTMQWITTFSIIIVNTFSNIHAACTLNKIKPVLWWIHESDIYGKVYSKTFEMYPVYRKSTKLDAVNVVAVSDNACNIFKRYYSNIEVRIMPYGLPDENFDNKVRNKMFVFAIIGTVSYLKGQDIFVDAAVKVMERKKDNVEFWLIGNNASEYANKVVSKVANNPFIKVKGEVNRFEMKKMFSAIDVVVSASREDSLPIVVSEGMMNSKACIVSDVIGSVKYIRNMENGIIFRSQDAEDLAQKMLWCIDNRNSLRKIGDNARRVYERIFSMESFGKRLEKEIRYTKNKFKFAYECNLV